MGKLTKEQGDRMIKTLMGKLLADQPERIRARLAEISQHLDAPVTSKDGKDCYFVLVYQGKEFPVTKHAFERGELAVKRFWEWKAEHIAEWLRERV